VSPTKDVRSLSGRDFFGMQALLPRFEIQILPDLQVYCTGFPLSPELSFWSWEPEVLNSVVHALLENKLKGLEAYQILEGG
jgi:hypothetical protein